MANQDLDLAGLLTGISNRPQPVQRQPIPGSPNFRGMFGAQMASDLQAGVGKLVRGGAPSQAQKMQQFMSQLDLNSVEDLTKLAKIMQASGDIAGAAKVAAKIQVMQAAGPAAAEEKRRDERDYQLELRKINSSGTEGRFTKGSTMTLEDSKERAFVAVPVINSKTGELELKYSAIDGKSGKPEGDTSVTGGDFALTALQHSQKELNDLSKKEQAKVFQGLKIISTDALPALYDNKKNIMEAFEILKTLPTGGPINLAAYGIEDFLGATSGDRADFERVLSMEVFKSLKPIFGGVISEGERASLLEIAATVKRGNKANTAIIERLISDMNQRIGQAELYSKSDTYDEYNAFVKTLSAIDKDKEDPVTDWSNL